MTTTTCSCEQPLNDDILSAIRQRFDYMINRHCRVLFVRMDIRFPDGTHPHTPNRTVSRFTASMCRTLRNHSLNPQYVWVREQACSENPHYHFIWLLDGTKRRHPEFLFEAADRLWAKHLGLNHAGGLIERCWRGGNGILLERNNGDLSTRYSDCINRASYLAKTYTKGQAGLNTHEWAASQCPH